MSVTQYSSGPGWMRRIADAIEGELLTDVFARGRYATDASIYQCFPQAVVLPRNASDIAAVLEIARSEGIGTTVRGGGTSTAGQALGEGIVIDCSRHMGGFLFHDEGSRTCVVEPGITLDALNRSLRPYRMWFPVDIASSASATIGGMLGNNASGMRALRYGRMADNVLAADALLADGTTITFADSGEPVDGGALDLPDALLDLLQYGEANENTLRGLLAEGRLPPAAADLRALMPSETAHPFARLLAGSEGQFAIATRIELKLTARPRKQAVGICRFRSLKSALEVVPAIAALGPSAIELLDDTLIAHAGHHGAALEPHILRALHGEPAALLVVEFAEDNPVENSRRLKELDGVTAHASGPKLPLVEVMGAKAQTAVWRFRRQVIEAAMGVRGAVQPVSFLEDCAVPLANLPAFADALARVLRNHALPTAVYGHAGSGCLHVRPALNLRHREDVAKLRELADAILPLLKKFDGRLTGGYGLGLARLPLLHEAEGEAARLMTGIKAILDPQGLLNPGKLLGSARFDDPAMFRIGVSPPAVTTVTGAREADLLAEAEACSGLALCRKLEGAFACPSFQVTRDERDSPRGRANSVRLALSSRLGDDAFGSDGMLATMSLCVSCKACTRLCPKAIDIPRVKAYALGAARKRRTPSAGEEFCARLPFHMDRARSWRYALRLRDLLPGLPRLSERWLGLAADRPWPSFRGWRFKAPVFYAAHGAHAGRTVALFADCFNQSFEPAALHAASEFLATHGYRVVMPDRGADAHPLCCGRTLYDAGLMDEARAQARRLAAALTPIHAAGVPIVALEPGCVSMLREEARHLLADGPETPPVRRFEEFLMAERAARRFKPKLKPVEARLVVHPHCHERAHGVSDSTVAALRLVPGLEVAEAPPGCCGLNGAFGYTPETFETSLAMAEIALFPALRKAGRDTLVAASGFSCRKQIRDGLGRPASHPAIFLALSLNAKGEAGEPQDPALAV
jgi:FAD/FMN-containing dehydrogenase/Fe-S oxidoreductase